MFCETEQVDSHIVQGSQLNMFGVSGLLLNMWLPIAIHPYPEHKYDYWNFTHYEIILQLRSNIALCYLLVHLSCTLLPPTKLPIQGKVHAGLDLYCSSPTVQHNPDT